MAADHFCLRWNNHQSTLVSVFDDLLESETLVDCTLAADGKYLKAHKVVLSACSPYLGMILSQHYDQHPIIILKDVKYEEMKAMLDYMYRGEVNISQEHLATFLKAAECLQIKGLTDVSSLNEEANKKQLQVERPPSSDESTTSAPIIDDDIPSREGSCSPTPKKMKQEVLSKNNIESNRIEKEVRAGINDVVSDLSVRNSVSSAFKHTGSDVAKNSIYVKKEPLDEPSYDGVMPSNVKGSEESKKGIPRPGPSNGSNSSIVGSPWLMSVDSTGDEMQMGSEQDVENKGMSNDKTKSSRVKKENVATKMNPVVRLRVLRPEELGQCFDKTISNEMENLNSEANNQIDVQEDTLLQNDENLKEFFKHLKNMAQGGKRQIVIDIKRCDVQSSITPPSQNITNSTISPEIVIGDDKVMIFKTISEPIVKEKQVLQKLVPKIEQYPETIVLPLSPDLSSSDSVSNSAHTTIPKPCTNINTMFQSNSQSENINLNPTVNSTPASVSQLVYPTSQPTDNTSQYASNVFSLVSAESTNFSQNKQLVSFQTDTSTSVDNTIIKYTTELHQQLPEDNNKDKVSIVRVRKDDMILTKRIVKQPVLRPKPPTNSQPVMILTKRIVKQPVLRPKPPTNSQPGMSLTKRIVKQSVLRPKPPTNSQPVNSPVKRPKPLANPSSQPVNSTTQQIMISSTQSVCSPSQSVLQPLYTVAQQSVQQPVCNNTPQPVLYPPFMFPFITTNNTNQFHQNTINNQQVGQQMVILNPNQSYVTNLQPS